MSAFPTVASPASSLLPSSASPPPTSGSTRPPSAFDASTLRNTGAALLHGSKLVLAPPHALSLDELASLLLQERISSLWLTAALFEQMASLQPSALASVSQLLAGGDALPPSRVREHLSRLPLGHLFVNGYGPTENTTFSATFPLRHGDSFSLTEKG
ncbi:AMP-binding protein [Myxococcus stipitatus]|uniref:AMP-binding protein n=1 Tax=Myxococcus stipitatus TaxID=83455 RepID=UPI00191C6DEA